MLKLTLNETLKHYQNQCISEPLSSPTVKDMGNSWLHSQVKIA